MRLGFLIIGLIVLLLVPVWIFWLNPLAVQLSPNFEYAADIISTDNFYDEATQDFTGPQQTVTTFTYQATGEQNGVLTVANVFDVRTVAGDPVFSVEREYGVDRSTGQHVTGHGDKDRDGYLFAPRGLKPGDSYTYWHINYDNPAQMQFIGEEEIEGLRVFVFQSQGLTADQTQNLTHLPGVPETRGVTLDVDLKTWIEPVSGYLVKYEDQTLASYYDLTTGDLIHPWNRFGNVYQRSSITDHVRAARAAKMRIVGLQWGVPIVLGVLGGVLIILAFAGPAPNKLKPYG